MRRPNLRNLPAVEPPEGYAFRHYQPGDERAWETIIGESFQRTGDDFEARMKADPAFQPQRVWFITQNDEPVATASAWQFPNLWPNTGVMHMVGVRQGHSGKRLGFWVSLAVLHQFLAEGLNDAMLQTDDFRIPAIKIYLKLGFEPLLIDENQRNRWSAVFQTLGGDLETQFKDILTGPVVKTQDH
jgi:mycothiol synthase